jgi:hypothetical protein
VLSRIVARIRSTCTGDGSLRVAVSGSLTSLDMRRLEHVCSVALTSADPDLEIHLGAVTKIDATARAILRCLELRGIRLIDTRQLLRLPISYVHRSRPAGATSKESSPRQPRRY